MRPATALRTANRTLLNGVLSRSPRSRRLFWSVYYASSLRTVADDRLALMNLGHAGDEDAGAAAGEGFVEVQNRLGAALYTTVAGTIRPRGELVDVGCGRAGGLRAVLDRHPAVTRAVGLDLTAGFIELGRRRHAEALDAGTLDLDVIPAGGVNLAPASIDAALSIEVLHAVPSVAELLAPVARALRPDGRLAVADIVYPHMSGSDERALLFGLRAAGLRPLDQVDLTAPVLAAREIAGAAERADGWVARTVPRPLWREAREAFFLPGTVNFDDLRRRRIRYVSWVLEPAVRTTSRPMGLAVSK